MPFRHATIHSIAHLLAFVCSCMVAATAFGLPPAPRTEAAALEARLTRLAEAAGLDRGQAEAVYRQLPDAPLVPHFREVADETRPDGTRNIFLLYDNNPRAECHIVESDDLQACRRFDTAVPWLLFVQVAPDGRVVRTGHARPFPHPSSPFGTRLDAARLRLVAPQKGAPAVAVVDGFRTRPPEDLGGGHFTATTWVYDVRVWNGREGFDIDVSYVADNRNRYGNDEVLGRLVVGDDGEMSVEATACDAACKCKRPRSLAANDAEMARIARAPGKCAITRRPVRWPADFGLVSDDLEARTPKRDAAAARAAIPVELAAAAGISEATATTIWNTARGGNRSPIFGHFERQMLSDGAVELLGVVVADAFVECVYSLAQSAIFDAVRACAHKDGRTMATLYARVNGDGTVAAAHHHILGATPPTRLFAFEPGQHAIETFRISGDANGPKKPFLVHEITLLREGRYHRTETLAMLGSSDKDKTRWDRFFGDAEVVTDGRLKRLKIRRADCNPNCPCPDLPKDAASERALVDARATATNPDCRPKERWVDW